jgi:hypothetical protein
LAKQDLVVLALGMGAFKLNYNITLTHIARKIKASVLLEF